MPAVVINGTYTPGGQPTINWPSCVGAGPFDGYAVVGNTQNTTQTFTGASIAGGTAPGDFSIDLTQFPVVVNPGQSAIIHVRFAPTLVNTFRTTFVTLANATNPNYIPQIYCIGLQVPVGTTPATAQPTLQFPTTKVGQSTIFTNAAIVNTSNVAVTVSNITLVTGTDYFIVGAPIVPFVINAGASSALFSIQFTPTVAGFRLDTLNITTSGAGGVTEGTAILGNGSVLQSAFIMTGGTQGTLFAFPGVASPLILLANPNSLNTEEAGSFVKLHDFQIPNIEKQMMRVRGHYEDLGVATIMVTFKAKRQGQPDEIIQVSVPIGTVAADGWIREFTSEPTPVTGELVQVTISRAAASGPVSIIDYIPEFEIKGQVIGGT